MSLSRRSLFGLFAGAPVVAAGVAKAVTEPEFFVGQVRATFLHYEAMQILDPGHTHGFYTASYYTTPVPVYGHEQWNGTEWQPISTPTDTGGR